MFPELELSRRVGKLKKINYLLLVLALAHLSLDALSNIWVQRHMNSKQVAVIITQV